MRRTRRKRTPKEALEWNLACRRRTRIEKICQDGTNIGDNVYYRVYAYPAVEKWSNPANKPKFYLVTGSAVLGQVFHIREDGFYYRGRKVTNTGWASTNSLMPLGPHILNLCHTIIREWAANSSL